MDPCYRNTHLKLLGTGVMRSYPFLVSFFQIGELSLSSGVLGPSYTLKIMLSPTLSFLGKGH